MVIRPKITEASEEIIWKILCFLHYRYANSENIVFTEKEICGFLTEINPRIINYAIEEVSETVFVDREYVDEDNNKVYGYMITREGIKEVESWPDDKYNQIPDGIDFIEDEIPASDRVVDLDHNSQDYREAITSLDAFTKEFQENHRIDNQLGREKSALVFSLKAGRELLKDTKVRVNAVLKLVVEPLKIIASRYERELAGGTAGALAAAAIKAILKLIGLG